MQKDNAIAYDLVVPKVDKGIGTVVWKESYKVNQFKSNDLCSNALYQRQSACWAL